ncbi:DUF3825 domain-containing protein [Actinobacillus suis]|uniref:DUF3825 domain-containing protein n=1 Tax=Actinobacillus suis TaxID=716 RepID=UPI00345E2026
MVRFNLFPDIDKSLTDLSTLAEYEDWDYKNTQSSRKLPVLYNYIQYTYTKLAQEGKLEISIDGQYLTFNTGLVTSNQEPIFAFCSTNRNTPKNGNKLSPWYFNGWKRKGEFEMQKFTLLPDMAHYFDNPSDLVFDCKKELIVNIEHIIADNKERFPEPYYSMPDYTLQIVLKGAIDNAKERVRRNYKTAIPHFYRNKVQLLLPLCLSKPGIADLAIVVESSNQATYRAATCLTLDMAYNNARQLARPDRDWLIP